MSIIAPYRILFSLCLLAPLAHLHTLSCQHYSLVRYRLTFQAEWSEENFPKQYPTVRPPAQWSKLIGRSHNNDYKLWSAGVLANSAIKKFAQEGSSELLEKIETQGFDGILDMFSAPPLLKGVGEMSADFFASNNHPLVSLIVRIVPSPDWFVGVDSVQLCNNGTWLTELTVPLNPVDAGTDRGYTFTSPKWASRPQETVHHITSQYPNHRANSFYYPELNQLPNIGRMKFELLADFKSHKVHREVRQHREPGEIPQLEEDLEQKREKVEEQQILHGEPILPADSRKPLLPNGGNGNGRSRSSNMLEERLPMDQQSRDDEPPVRIQATPAAPKAKIRKHIKFTTPPSTPMKSNYDSRNGNNNNNRNQKQKTLSKTKAGDRQDCQVGDWGLWAPCSKTCGFGVQKRYRKVVQIPVQGRPCPKLEQEKWCGSMRTCREESGLFSWLDKNKQKQSPNNRG